MGSKKSKRKADKVRREYHKVRPGDPIHVYEVNVRTTPGTDATELAHEVADRLNALDQNISPEPSIEELTDPPIELEKRWEKVNYIGFQPAVYDKLTGLYAVCDDDEQADDILEDLLNEGLPIDVFAWRHRRSDANVIITSSKALARFWLLITDDNERGILDRTSQKVLPIREGIDLSDAVDLVAELNDVDGGIKANEFDWIEVEDWIAPPPEDDPSRAAAAPEPGPEKALRVLVVSSREWAYSSVVHELIQTLWNATDNRPMTILTSGMPYGAEGVASQLVNTTLHDGATPITHEIIRDEAIATADIDYAFAFITNYSSGATAALDAIKMAGIPVHVMNETSAQPNDPWAER